MCMNKSLKYLFIFTLGLLVGYFANMYIMKYGHKNDDVAPVVNNSVQVKTEEKEGGKGEQKPHVTINGRDCDVLANFTNPYNKSESIVASASCHNPGSVNSLFLTNGDGKYTELLTDSKYEYQFKNVYSDSNGDIFTFLDRDNIVYVAASAGEGLPDAGGVELSFNKLNIRSGEVETLATEIAGYMMHDFSADETNACFDERDTYTFSDIEIKSSIVCDGPLKSGFRNLSVTSGKNILVNEKVSDSVERPYKLSGLMNTVAIELGRINDIGFQANGHGYSLNAQTGKVLKTY